MAKPVHKLPESGQIGIRRHSHRYHLVCRYLIESDTLYIISHLFQAQHLCPKLINLSLKNLFQLVFPLYQFLLFPLIDIYLAHQSIGLRIDG